MRKPAATAVAADLEKTLLDACSIAAEDCLSRLASRDKGLSEEEAEEKRKEFGRNEVITRKGGWLVRTYHRFANPLVIQLLIIAGVSFIMGDLRSTIVVAGMVFISVGLSSIQEERSGRAVESLQAMVRTTANVLREGKEQEIPLAEIVPGDIVVLDAGSLVPADIRLIATKDFFVSQSALTGESMPVEKSAAAVTGNGKSALELPNACFQGSNVLSGSARGVVVNTGSRTFFGAITRKLAGQRTRTSFDKGIAGFTWLMIRFMVVMVAVVFLIIGITKHNWMDALLFGLAVAVGLTPEMLPMIVTVNLAKGALAMSKKKVIVKKLGSIQNFGAIDILCTDKTGTLTQDRVILEKHVDVTGRDSDDVLKYAYMNSFYQTGLRNLLDRSVLSHTEFEVERKCPEGGRDPLRFHAQAHVGGGGLRRRPRDDLQGRGGGRVQGLHAVPGGRRHQPAHRHDPPGRAGGLRGAERGRLPRACHRLPRVPAGQDGLRRGRREST